MHWIFIYFYLFFLHRQISGALVHIAKGEGTHENGENEDRHITITGNKDSISVAKYLIEMRYNFIIILKNILFMGSKLRMNSVTIKSLVLLLCPFYH